MIMAEQPQKHHVETYPAEKAAPEMIDHPVHKEPGATVQADDINVGVIAVVGIFTAVLLFLVIVVLQAWFYDWAGKEQERKTVAPAEVAVIRAEQLDQINRYRVVARDANNRPTVYALPIDRAMELEARALAARQTTPENAR